MRILLAVDGSVSADHATRLVSTLALPEGSIVRIVAVQEPSLDVLGMTWIGTGEDPLPAQTEAERIAQHRREAVEAAERVLERPGLKVEGFLLRGRPGSEIVDEAKAFEADLVVVGNRGHGAIASMVLGSTAAEVVDHAPCPVLVARGETLEPLAFADDGSASARTAEQVIATWPIFATVPVHVVAVAEIQVPMATGFTPGLYDQVMASYTEAVDQARVEMRRDAEQTAARLAAGGRETSADLLEGSPAQALIDYVQTRGIATLVMGTRGHTGLARLILGSTARNVLLHSPCSVLIVRERKEAEAPPA